jgi:hypothetical protein
MLAIFNSLGKQTKLDGHSAAALSKTLPEAA